MKIKYNLLALAGSLISIANTFLTWQLFGSTSTADIWLLSQAITNTLGLIVLMGVEQFLIFYTSSLNQEKNKAGEFLFSTIIWSLLYGFIFTLICYLCSSKIIEWFAEGLDQNLKNRLWAILTLMLFQIAFAPLVHVTRNTLNAHHKYGQSYSISLITPIILLISQYYLFLTGKNDIFQLGYILIYATIGQAIMCLFFLGKWSTPTNKIITNNLINLIKNSILMRFGHSFHNFFVSIIINSTLSHYSTGMISSFQYAKKFSDGIVSIAAGPQINIYTSKQAAAWSTKNHNQHINNIKNYLYTTIPILLIGSFLVSITIPNVLEILNKNTAASLINTIQTTFNALTFWQLIICIEAVFVSTIATSKRSILLILINLLFIISFYSYCQKINNTDPIWYLAAAATLSQLSSIFFFFIAAKNLEKKHYLNKYA